MGSEDPHSPASGMWGKHSGGQHGGGQHSGGQPYPKPRIWDLRDPTPTLEKLYRTLSLVPRCLGKNQSTNNQQIIPNSTTTKIKKVDLVL